MQTLRKDLAFAVRSVRNHPAFAVTAVLTLALGIGASTAIFSVVNAVLLRPLPYANADRLVTVWADMRARKVRPFFFSPPTFQDLKRGTSAFEDLAAVFTFRQAMGGEDGRPPEQVRVAGATTNLLSLLGARVMIGRNFIADDATPAPEPPPNANPQQVPQPPPLPAMVVLNHGFWQRRFGGDPNVVGKTFDLGNLKARVVGVLAPGFELLFPANVSVEPMPDLIVAVRINYETANRNNVFFRVVGRLKPGVTVEQAESEAERVAADMRERFPITKTADTHFYVVPMHEDLVGGVRPAITALTGAVLFVLLIACANVANLLLVRASARERELAVRAALGSSPWGLVRQMLAESLVLAVGGALLGLALAYAGIKVLVALAPENLPRLDDVGIDPLVLGFAVLAAVASAALFGAFPSIRASRPDLAELLRSGGRTPGLHGGKLLRNGVVMAEVALSFVLLIGCGLMIRSFVALQRTNPGYDPKNVLTFEADNPFGQTPDARAAYQRRLRERLMALPGVVGVTAANPLPLDGGIANSRWGPPEAAGDPSKFQQANAHFVLPGYFESMRTRLIAGRVYTEADNRDSAKVIVIDRLLAEKAFPAQSAIGKQLLVRIRSPEPELLEVIGVVEHQRHETLAADGRQTIFFTDGFLGHGAADTWAVRTSTNPTQLAPAVRAVVAEIEPRVPVSELQPMQALVDRAMGPTRFALALISVFAFIAAVLAAVGLYGVLSTTVRQRTAEIGVRMAFGAPHRSIFGLMIGEGLKLSAAGVALGLIAAYMLTRIMSSMLVGVRATDPATFGAIVLVFFVIAGVASWLPARRAAGLEPTIALREE
jgi:putative ABC transport system permease protein